MSRAPTLFLIRAGRWRSLDSAIWIFACGCYWLFSAHLVLASQILIAGLFALSLDLILGYGGIVTLGHAAFFGFGAYVAGNVARGGWGEPLSGLVAAAAGASLLGYLTSFLVLRGTDLTRLMVTLGVALLLYEAGNRATDWTGGVDGLQGIEMWPLFGAFRFDLYGRVGFAYTLAVVFVLFLCARRLVASPFGLTLKGIRENPQRVEAVGGNVRARLTAAYAIAAGMAGVAGALLAQTTQFVALDVLSFQRSAEVVIMLVLGGAGALYGGFIGAALYMVAQDRLAGINPHFWYFWQGVMLVVIVLFVPGGLLGGVQRTAAHVMGKVRSRR
jgi:branched-chain amino acid transport system permease protein